MESSAKRLLDDHHRCDQLLWDAYAALIDGDRIRAATLYAEFRPLILEHMELEDATLFPPLAAQSALLADYVQKMLTEHRQLRGLMEELEVAMRGEDPAQTLFLAERLMRNMRGHTQKEELMVIPALENAAA